MRYSQRKFSPAFTLVELLLVIVVIGILAAITIVSFQGIQAKARNIQIIEGVRQYSQAIELYKVSNGIYPKTSGEVNGDYIALTCLGTGYAAASCGKVTGTTIYEDATFNTAMASVIGGTPPAIGANAIVVVGETFTGAVYGIDTTAQTPRGRTIQYALYGTNVNCGLPGAYGYNVSSSPPTTACEIYLEAYP